MTHLLDFDRHFNRYGVTTAAPNLAAKYDGFGNHRGKVLSKNATISGAVRLMNM
jgi:hypothetical protein